MLCAAVLGAMALAPARAAVVTFEDVTPNFFAPGETFQSGGFTFAPLSGFTDVDNASAYFFANAPTGNATQFAGVFNDGSVSMSTGNGKIFQLTRLDFGFVSPIGGLGSTSPGRLVLLASLAAGGLVSDSFDFGPADANGDFAFHTTTSGSVIDGRLLSSLTFSACVYDSSNVCVNPSFDQAQFAIDNLVTQVPEPASLALVAVALLFGGTARRRKIH